MNIRPMHYEEWKYTYAQSNQLIGATGSIGYLRGDFDSNGRGFYTTWFDQCFTRKTEEFKTTLDMVINWLRSDEILLKDLSGMKKFVKRYPDSRFGGSYTTEYGFRVEEGKYVFLLRCNTKKGDYNFYCWCFDRALLDRHMEKARQGIRFIDSHYNDKFCLPDDKSIVIKSVCGQTFESKCRFVDETHCEIGMHLYHICQFAEKLEREGATCFPKEIPLPLYCFGNLPSTGEIIKITRYEKGYTPLKVHPIGASGAEGAERLNTSIGVSKAQAAAMFAGSLFGWDCPAAKAEQYDDNGKAIVIK